MYSSFQLSKCQKGRSHYHTLFYLGCTQSCFWNLGYMMQCSRKFLEHIQMKKDMVYLQLRTESHRSTFPFTLLDVRVPFFDPVFHCNRQKQERGWWHVTAQQCEPKLSPCTEVTSEVCFCYLRSACVSLRVPGASIDINCETNGDIDAMDCSWKNTQWTKLKFRSR